MGVNHRRLEKPGEIHHSGGRTGQAQLGQFTKMDYERVIIGIGALGFPTLVFISLDGEGLRAS